MNAKEARQKTQAQILKNIKAQEKELEQDYKNHLEECYRKINAASIMGLDYTTIEFYKNHLNDIKIDEHYFNKLYDLLRK